MSQMSSSGWLLAFIISLLLSLLMGLALVWLSIERTDCLLYTSFGIKASIGLSAKQHIRPPRPFCQDTPLFPTFPHFVVHSTHLVKRVTNV